MARSILVAEDSPTQAEHLRLLLEGAGYRVRLAASGREGLEVVRSAPPDLIISDVVMPEMDGYAFCRAVKGAEATRRIPFVLLTEQKDPMNIILGLERGADNFLTKPFEDDSLLERLRRIFEHLELRRKGHLEMEVTMFVGGREVVLSADKQQIIELLFSTIEEAGQVNARLKESQQTIETYARWLEEKVEERTRELRSLFDRVPVGLFRSTPEGQILDANLTLVEMLGYPDRESLLSVNAKELYVTPEDRLRWQAQLDGEGLVDDFEVRFRRHDGRVIWGQNNVRSVRDSTGRVLCYEGSMRDITGQKRAEETTRALAQVGHTLSQSLDLAEVGQRIADSLRGLFKARVSGLYQLNPESGDLTAIAISGTTAPPPGRKVVFPRGVGTVGLAVAERRPAATADVLADPRLVLTPEARAFIEQAGYRSVLAVPLAVKGNVIGALTVGDEAGRTFSDEEIRLVQAFADQAAVALDNVRLYEEVRTGRDFLQSIVQNSTDAIITTDIRGRITYFSPGAEEIFGFKAEEVIGRPVADFYRSGPEEARALMQRLRTDGQVRNYETTYRARDGRWVSGNVSLSLLRGAGGEVTGILSVMRDVTEIKRAEEELHDQREALIQREKVATMGMLLAGVAHELNNPLSVVTGQAALLRRMAGSPAVDERAGKIEKAAERCARIVKNFLALARQHPPERSRVSLNQVVQDAVELLAYQLRVDDVEVVLRLADGLPGLWADPHQLHQVVINLASNAHDAMREAPRPWRVELITAYDPARGRAMLEVADTGPGIPPEIRARIFEPFFTTKPVGKGTGLGLSLCLGIVESHGGSIRVEGRPERGAKFIVELPVEAAPAAERERPAVDSLPLISGKAILVVDDEPEIASVLAELLAVDGHEVETATNGAHALAKLSERDYDLVLTDVKMPELDGPGLFREIEHRHPRLRRRVIFLTGDTLSPGTSDFLAQTGALSLSKPFDPVDVQRAVQRTLRTVEREPDEGPPDPHGA